jgi:predicted PurR-regulated permease PerM
MLAGVRVLAWVNILGSAILVIAFFYWARAVLIPLALAVLLTFLLNPVVKRLQRLGLWRVPSVVLVVILASSLLGGIGWVVMVQLTTLAHDLPQYESNIMRKIAELRQLGKGGVIERVQRSIQDIVAELQGELPEESPPQPMPSSGVFSRPPCASSPTSGRCWRRPSPSSSASRRSTGGSSRSWSSAWSSSSSW